MRIACVGYRDWALNIYLKLQKTLFDHKVFIHSSENNFSIKQLIDFEPDLILFYGWSKVIPSKLVDNFICLMLHPSPLPKYRGGSPIQNQIIRGEVNSAVTIFIMDNGIDTGPISRQKFLSLKGNLSDILMSIQKIGYDLTLDIIDNGLNSYEQDHLNATFYKRLKPSMSEISIKELTTFSGTYLHNKIRMLQDPYPNAYIKTADNKKLYIINTEIKDD